MALAKSRLQERYEQDVRPRLMTERGLKNLHMVPRIVKTVVNVGVGEGRDNPKALENAVRTLTTIAGQKAVITLARKSISNFKIRAGMKIGCMVTLRSHVMWHFLDKLLNVVLPRVRDFQGVSVKNFDGRGNYNLGLRDQLVRNQLWRRLRVFSAIRVTERSVETPGRASSLTQANAFDSGLTTSDSDGSASIRKRAS